LKDFTKSHSPNKTARNEQKKIESLPLEETRQEEAVNKSIAFSRVQKENKKIEHTLFMERQICVWFKNLGKLSVGKKKMGWKKVLVLTFKPAVRMLGMKT